MKSWFANRVHGVSDCGAAPPSPFVPRFNALQFDNVRKSLHALVDDSRVTDSALIAKLAAQLRRIVYNAIGRDVLRWRTSSDRVFSYDECKTVWNVTWSTAPLPR